VRGRIEGDCPRSASFLNPPPYLPLEGGEDLFGSLRE
jgi:hypothetical protein